MYHRRRDRRHCRVPVRARAARTDGVSGLRADLGRDARSVFELRDRTILRTLSRGEGFQARSSGRAAYGVIMDIRENVRVALDTLRSRKARSALTILGIVIGVTSVIAVAAIIDGLNGYMLNRINSFGSRSFFITRIPPGYTGVGRMPAKIRTRKYLEISASEISRYLRVRIFAGI